MRGEGRRRLSNTESISAVEGAAAASAGAVAGPSAALREGGIRRKPVPSTVMEASSGDASPQSQEFIDPTMARSSAAQEIDRGQSPVTPGNDDSPYIRFALDQLTIDEDVRGSRRYPGQSYSTAGPTAGAPVMAGAQPYQQQPVQPGTQVRDMQNLPAGPSDDQGGVGSSVAAGAAALGVGAAATAAGVAYSQDRGDQIQPPPTQQWPHPSRQYDELPPRHPRHVYHGNAQQHQQQDPDVYMPISEDSGLRDRLNFVPAMLRLPALLAFILLLLVVLALLLLCAIWTLTHKGIFDYGSFGDSKYFIFQYLPPLLAMLVLVWLIQIQVAVYRLAPFLAMSIPDSPRSWEEGAKLPVYPKTWFLPYLGHFGVPGLAIPGFFMVVAWLQIWTIPFIASAFNVYFFGDPATGSWRWVATAALVWIVIAFYLLLLIAIIVLLIWLRNKTTGLRWDPRSLADMIVLLEHSNALTLTEDDEIRHEPAKLGYWRTSRGNPGDIFHAYGVAEKPGRMYAVRNGRLTEKQPVPAAGDSDPKSRFSDFDDVEMGREQRNSREKMLPRRVSRSSSRSSSPSSNSRRSGGNAIPWFLHASAALLWIIIALVLLVAFLVVSYLPSTNVADGFRPLVSAPVSSFGFSYTNFLYSFLPAILAMILFLGLLDIDYAYRRLQPYASLTNAHGELAEKSLLVSYAADLPFKVSASAAVNGHLRVAVLSFASLIAATIPILAGGCFWAQFNVSDQNIRIYAHVPAYYALTVFVAIVAFAIVGFVWPTNSVRSIDDCLPRGNKVRTWLDIVALVRSSRLVDDVAFRAPASKTDLVTRLLSSPTAVAGPATLGRSQDPNGAAASKVSLADSVRGFGRARQAAAVSLGESKVPRFTIGRFTGRDGRDGVGLDRLRS